MGVDDKTLLRFMDKVKSFERGKCWEWNASKLNSGYGQFSYLGKRVTAHRFSYFMVNSPQGAPLHVCHTCDNKICVNPDHLWLGTAQDNHRDKTDKGRHHYKKRTHCPKGHEFTIKNTLIRTDNGSRKCRLCEQARLRRYRNG